MHPKIIKILPEIILRICWGIRVVTYAPAIIANPSTRINAVIAPKKSMIWFFVREDNKKRESWLLSNNSATSIAKKGIKILSSITYTVNNVPTTYATAAAVLPTSKISITERTSFSRVTFHRRIPKSNKAITVADIE